MLLLDAIVAELEGGGMLPQQVVVVVATGLHRPIPEDELARALGRRFGLVTCENHNANDP